MAAVPPGNAAHNGGLDLTLALEVSPFHALCKDDNNRGNRIGNNDNDGVKERDDKLDDVNDDADVNANLEERLSFPKPELHSSMRQLHRFSDDSGQNQDVAGPVHNLSEQQDNEGVPLITDLPSPISCNPVPVDASSRQQQLLMLSDDFPLTPDSSDERGDLPSPISCNPEPVDASSWQQQLLMLSDDFPLTPDSSDERGDMKVASTPTRSRANESESLAHIPLTLSFVERERSTSSLKQPATQVLRRSSKRQKKTTSTTKKIKGEDPVVKGKYPWSAPGHAKLLSADEILRKGIRKIRGELQCEKCKTKLELEFDLIEKFLEVADYLLKYRFRLSHRADEEWFKAVFPCQNCSASKGMFEPLKTETESINWLFLFLGRVLGYCHLNDLKYFCEHNRLHRTGAKDRDLFYTAFGICKQLDPFGNFDI